MGLDRLELSRTGRAGLHPRPARGPLALASVLLSLLPLLVLANGAAASGGVDVRRGGSSWARIGEDGSVRVEGRVVGDIEKDGSIRRHGSLWGSASPCCPGFRDVRRVAALLFFFDRGYFGP